MKFYERALKAPLRDRWWYRQRDAARRSAEPGGSGMTNTRQPLASPRVTALVKHGCIACESWAGTASLTSTTLSIRATESIQAATNRRFPYALGITVDSRRRGTPSHPPPSISARRSPEQAPVHRPVRDGARTTRARERRHWSRRMSSRKYPRWGESVAMKPNTTKTLRHPQLRSQGRVARHDGGFMVPRRG